MALLVAANGSSIHNRCWKQHFLRQCGSSQQRSGGRYSRKRYRGVVFATIGFSPNPRMNVEKIAADLLKDVASLLVYQDVFRSQPAQAFLKVLVGLSRRADGMNILESYGEFFKLMASGQHSSWEDFLLEAILQAEGNPFAEAAAGVGNSSSAFGGEIPASLEAAAVSDLETLQNLSINESTLIGWVTELVLTAKDQWKNAASSNLSSCSVRKIKASTDREPDERALDITDKCEKPFKKNTDFVISEREQWRKKLGGLWKWSEAVPLLKEYHSQWGFGRVTTSQVMKLKGGRLVPDFKYLKEISGPDLAVWSKLQGDLYKNFRRHVYQSSGRHLFLYGPPGSGKSYLLRSTLQKLSEETRFRVVIVPSTEIKHLNTLLEEFRKNVHIFFFLVTEDLFLRAVEDTFLLLKATFDDNLEEWPKNVLLCATSSRSEAQIGGSIVKLGDIFGMSMALTKLEQEQYLKCVDEILQYKIQKAELTLSQNETDIQQNAIKWGEEAGFSLKNAAAFAEGALQSD